MRNLNRVLVVGLLGVSVSAASTQTEPSWWDHTKCTVTLQGWGCPDPVVPTASQSVLPVVSSPVVRASATRSDIPAPVSVTSTDRVSSTPVPAATSPDAASGITVSPEGHLYTKDGQIILTGFGNNKKPLTYEPGMKVVYGPDGQPTHVEGDNMCYIADFADPATVPPTVLGRADASVPAASSVRSGTAASSILDFTGNAPGTSEPSQNESIIAAARKGEGLPAGATVEQINLYNQNLAIPYRPISTDCGSDFIGPPAPGQFCGPQGSALAMERTVPARSADPAPSVSSPADIEAITGSADASVGVSAPVPSERVSPGVSMVQDVVTPDEVENPEDAVTEAVDTANRELDPGVITTVAGSEPVTGSAVASVSVSEPFVGPLLADDEPSVDVTAVPPVRDVTSGPRFVSAGSSALTSDEDREEDERTLVSTPDRDPDTDEAMDDFVRNLHGVDVDEDEVIVVPNNSSGPTPRVSDTAIAAAQPIVQPLVADEASSLDLAAVRAQRTIPRTTVVVRDGLAVTEDGAVVLGKQVTVGSSPVPTITQQDLLNAGATAEEVREQCGDSEGEELANCVRNNPYMGQYIWILTTTSSGE